MAEDPHDMVLKMILVGDTGVGKSSLLDFYIQRKKLDPHLQSTIGVEFGVKELINTRFRDKQRDVGGLWLALSFQRILTFVIRLQKAVLSAPTRGRGFLGASRQRIVYGTHIDLHVFRFSFPKLIDINTTQLYEVMIFHRPKLITFN